MPSEAGTTKLTAAPDNEQHSDDPFHVCRQLTPMVRKMTHILPAAYMSMHRGTYTFLVDSIAGSPRCGFGGASVFA